MLCQPVTLLHPLSILQNHSVGVRREDGKKGGEAYLEDPDVWERGTYSHGFHHSTPPDTFILLHPHTIKDIQKPTSRYTPRRSIRRRDHTSSSIYRFGTIAIFEDRS